MLKAVLRRNKALVRLDWGNQSLHTSERCGAQSEHTLTAVLSRVYTLLNAPAVACRGNSHDIECFGVQVTL